MKHLRTNLTLFLFSLVLSVLISNAYAQDSKDAKLSTVQELVEKKSYVFVAQTMMPMAGGTRQLTSVYAVKIKGDTLVCDLPYVGRVYQPTMNPSDQGLTFTSTQFDYELKVRKKGGWDVRIKTKDQSSQRQLALTIYENGSASLNVTCTDRQSINYRGALEMK